MRTTSLTISIAASLLLLGFAGQAVAVPSCASQHLPDFDKNLNKNTAWNNYVTSQLSIPANQWPGWTQLSHGFQTLQCATAWGSPNTYIGIKRISCIFEAPTPTVSGTSVNYQATPSNPAILKLHGCGALPVQLPAELAK